MSPDLEDVIMRALSPMQADRPATAQSMRGELLRSVPLPSRDARTPPLEPRPGAVHGSESPRPMQRTTPPVRARLTPVGSRAHRAARPTPAAASRDGTWDPAVLERARRDLAPYIGPLARVIVRRICDRAHDVRDLYELLALEIPSESERERFRHLAPQDSASPH